MHPLLIPLHTSFHAHADPGEAASMKAYLKDQFAFLGIKAGKRRALAKEFIKEVGKQDRTVPENLVREMWALPEREFQHTAIDLLIRYQRSAPLSHLDLYEALIVNKSWWDTVDMLAGTLVGTCFQRHPEMIQSRTEIYIQSGNMWLQRTALLFQLKYKQATDWELLKRYCLQCAGSKEFFIQKAIGWALRQYSKFEAELVRTFVETHELPALSRREALKYLNRQE
ncbi:MAG: DNA alkylation repair protein [Bacteroidota bacterium]